jgi:adhesin/invasin
MFWKRMMGLWSAGLLLAVAAAGCNQLLTTIGGDGNGTSQEPTISVSEANSTVVASPTSVSADGLSASTVTVTLKDTKNNPVSEHDVTISSGAHVTAIDPSSGTTDDSGQVSFTVKSAQEGIATITATDTTESVVVSNTATIAFTEFTPPADVTSFTATEGNGRVALSWANPTDGDFAGVKILRKTEGYPINPTDGAVVYEGTGTSHTDTGLTNKTTYYYVAFAHDEVPNYSSGAQASATPTDVT